MENSRKSTEPESGTEIVLTFDGDHVHSDWYHPALEPVLCGLCGKGCTDKTGGTLMMFLALIGLIALVVLSIKGVNKISRIARWLDEYMAMRSFQGISKRDYCRPEREPDEPEDPFIDKARKEIEELTGGDK